MDIRGELNNLVSWISRNRRKILVSTGGAFLVVILIGVVQLITMYSHYAGIVDARLSDRSWSDPSGIYAAPRRISAGKRISANGLVARLLRSGYREAQHVDDFALGSFAVLPGSVEVRTNEFAGSERLPQHVTVRFTGESVSRIEDGTSHAKVTSIDLPAELLTADIGTKVQTRRATGFDELPALFIKALTAIEDRTFFEHRGIDPKGMMRALWSNLTSGTIEQGGSTITQQFIKNQFLTPERTYARKFSEAMMAIALERRLTKKQILTLYCERVYLGHSGQTSIYGFKQAARVFFGKELHDLSLSEMATLAGAAAAPNRSSLHTGLGRAIERRNVVLRAMTEIGAVTSAEAAAARTEDLVVLPPQRLDEASAPHFVDYVKRELGRQRLEEDDWAQMRIETTLDPDLQEAANLAVRNHLNKLGTTIAKRKDGVRPEAALVAIDPKTGAILAMVGGSDYATSQLNRVTDAMRQPGSVFKPIVYAAALSRGFSPAMTFLNARRNIEFGDHAVYRPENFGNSYSNQQTTLREAMVRSLNVVTVDAAMQVGLGNVAGMARSMGLSIPRTYPSMALGAFEASPFEIARAYTTFANRGTRVEPFAITGIKSIGEILMDGSPTTASVLAPSLAYLVTDALEDVVNRGTARRVRTLGYQGAAAGKTGTSRDAWFVGYTPNLLVVVWVGYDDNRDLRLTGGEAAIPIWTDFIVRAEHLRPDLSARHFVKPSGVENVEIDTDTGLLANEFCHRRGHILVSSSTLPGFCYQHAAPMLALDGDGQSLQPEEPGATEVELPLVSVLEAQVGRELSSPAKPGATAALPGSLPPRRFP